LTADEDEERAGADTRYNTYKIVQSICISWVRANTGTHLFLNSVHGNINIYINSFGCGWDWEEENKLPVSAPS
jgi:hypothetical protein